MRHALPVLLLLLGGALGALPASAQTPFRAVATVNDAVITAWDVEQRARILRLVGGEDVDERALGNAALDALVENRLMLQAGKQAGITPTPEMIEEALGEMAGRSGMDAAAFRARLNEAGVTDQAIDDLVGAQAVWRQVIQVRFRDRIEPGEADISAEIALSSERRTTAVRLSEIGLAFEGRGRSRDETRALAGRLARELNAGADFVAAVRRWSDAPSAAEGGAVGWVPVEGLPPEMASMLSSLPEGGVTPPIEVQSGLSILKVEERRSDAAAPVDAADPALRERVRRSLMNARIDRLAQGLLQDLRRDALIQIR